MLLNANYVLDETLVAEEPLIIEESRGTLLFRLSPEVITAEGVAALNAGANELLAGGQWFQVWRGEIVSMATPEDAAQGGTVARLHRGQVVHEAS